MNKVYSLGDTLKQLGGKITKEDIKILEKSKNWKNGKFRNYEETKISFNAKKIIQAFYKQAKNKKNAYPKKDLAIIPFNEDLFKQKDGQIIWFGHSVALLFLNKKSILIDPMFGSDASPIAPFATRRFSKNTLQIIDSLPFIDIVLFSHNHYDHLDFQSVKKLKSKVEKFIVPLGMGRYLKHWGVEAQKIKELDWYESTEEKNIKYLFTPARHMTARGLNDHQKSLWGGWFIKTDSYSVWFSGDGGYGKHFKEIAEKIEAPDLAFIECGQYNEDWHPVHMFPKEGILAVKQVRAKKAIPIHWAGFNLSYQHTWKEPPEEFLKHAKENNVEVLLPKLGEVFNIKDSIHRPPWFKNVE